MAATNAATSTETALRRRRLILYTSAALALLLIAGVAAISLLDADEKPTAAPKLKAPVIVARIEMRPTRGGSARGLGEILRRGQQDSLRVLIARLKPSGADQAYQLVLAGGSAEERLLGTQKVGKQSVFVGESKVTLDEIQKHKWLELRSVEQGPPVKQRLVLRGKIPN